MVASAYGEVIFEASELPVLSITHYYNNNNSNHFYHYHYYYYYYNWNMNKEVLLYAEQYTEQRMYVITRISLLRSSNLPDLPDRRLVRWCYDSERRVSESPPISHVRTLMGSLLRTLVSDMAVASILVACIFRT